MKKKNSVLLEILYRADMNLEKGKILSWNESACLVLCILENVHYYGKLVLSSIVVYIIV